MVCFRRRLGLATALSGRRVGVLLSASRGADGEEGEGKGCGAGGDCPEDPTELIVVLPIKGSSPLFCDVMARLGQSMER